MPNKTARYADRYAASGNGAGPGGAGLCMGVGVATKGPWAGVVCVCETVLYIFMKNRCQFIKCGLDAS